ncbi:MAG TPA: hypothetical protein DC054_23350 [Blastocatellia bacterium]|nr:hypothetical protein [Blastocatellia bacterium]
MKQVIFTYVFIFGLLTTASAQESTTPQKSSLTITASAAGEQVRITAPSSVVQMHVEVYAASGERLFDQEIRGGNVFDWHLQDGQGQRLAPGSYVCVVTAKSVSGKLTQKIGTVRVETNAASVQLPEPLSAPQAQTIGPVEENASWTVPGTDEPQTTTVIAHDGTDGQMIRGRGALTFRIGNFFSGIDTEQMRLSEAGNLGIGTSEPKAKLDVAGTIRAERFLVARPKLGSATQASDSVAATDTTDSVQPLASGSGTQNHIAKWTDNAGALGDSAITETAGGNVGIGTTATVALDVYGKFKINNDGTGKWGASGAQGLLSWDTNLAIIGGYADNNLGLFANNTQYATLTTAGRFGIGTTAPSSLFEIKGAVPVLSINGTTSNSFRGLTFLDDGSDFGTKLTANASTGELRDSVGPSVAWGGFRTFYTDTTEKMRITSSGNVGVGTINPTTKLDVNGDINTSTQYSVGGNRVLSNGGLRNLFAGVGAGQNNIGGDNAFFGHQSGLLMTGGFGNSFFGTVAGTSSTGNLNSFFGRGAGIQTSGQANSFFGADAGFGNTSGSSNTLIGYGADVGANNLTNATAIGANAKVTQSNSLVLGSINGTNGAGADTNVGIGTSAPVNVLHLNGNHNDFALTFTNQSNTAGRRGYRIAFDSDRLTFQSAADSGAFAANQMTIDPPTGNVGIGTTAPSFKLHINDPSNTGLRVQNNTSGGTVAGFGGFGAFQIDTIATTGGRFTVKENGNTGIGTNNPNAKLQVVGGNVYIANPNGVIISSPNGVCWLIGVSNAGALTTIAVPCP